MLDVTEDFDPRTVTGVQNYLRGLDGRELDEQVIILVGCARSLAALADDIITRQAAANFDRKSGWSWTHIADLLGVTRQAASKKYRVLVDRYRNR